MLLAVLLTALAILSAAAGIRLTSIPVLSRKVLPFGGGVLVGIGVFWVLPEMAAAFGWRTGMVWLCAGFGLVWVIDRFVYPVCPSCSHTHDHDGCDTRLHGFATPLILAAGIHSFLDGWGITASGEQGSARLGLAVLAGIGIHKIPEGLALGVILRAAMTSRFAALGGVALAESLTIAGALSASLATGWLSANFGSAWVATLVALVGGSFLYLGYHAIDSEYRLRGVLTSFVPALIGMAGAAVLEEGVRVLMR